MKNKVLLLTLILSAFLCIQYVTAETVILTAEEFFDKVKEGDWFIKFYAPWCGHCKKLAPTWEELGNTEFENTNINIASVDCTKEGRICKAFEIKGYPTLKYLSNGKQYLYKGPRDIQKLKQFVHQKEYVDLDASELPSPNLPYDNEFFEALLIILTWAKENVIIALSFTGFFFLVIGCCLGTTGSILLTPSPKRPMPPKQPAESPKQSGNSKNDNNNNNNNNEKKKTVKKD